MPRDSCGRSVRRCRAHWVAALLLGLGAFGSVPAARSGELPEYRLKAAFVYNFIAFTDWPAAAGNTLNLCIYGLDPFGKEIDPLNGRVLGARTLVVQRSPTLGSLRGCQIVFVADSAMDELPRLLASLRGQPVLSVADSPGAVRQGVILNMNLAHGRVSFEANLGAARTAGLNLSSKLLRLATEVIQ